jgi:tetratricopeptide (TPR) repeat protein
MDSHWELANSLLEQGLAYKNIKKYTRACECFDQAKTIFRLLNLKKWENEVQITLASSITVHEEPTKAIEQLQQSLSAMLHEKDFSGTVFVYAKMAEIFLNMNKQLECNNALEEAFKLVKEKSLYDTMESGELHLISARYFYRDESFPKAIDYALKSSEIFGNINMIRDQVNTLKVAVDSYESLGNLEEALKIERKRNDLLQQLSEERSSL